MMQLVDERGHPPLRDRIGRLLADSDEAAFALARVRLAALDLSDRELRTVNGCRVLLGRLDAATLLDVAEPHTAHHASGRLRPLVDFAGSGRLEVRSAGVGGWDPDFSVYHGAAGVTALLGAHYFGSPYPTFGPSLTCMTTDPSAVRLVRARFDELWDVAHDVLPAVLEVLERANAGL